jgi:hypothetical protein
MKFAGSARPCQEFAFRPRASPKTYGQYSRALLFEKVTWSDNNVFDEVALMKSFALQGFETDNESSWRSMSTPGAVAGEADYCSREGAVALKAKIEAYWRERGQDVMLSLHNVGFHPAIRAARYDVRSDMVNGMPRLTSKRSAHQEYSVSLVDTPEEGDDVWIDD